MNFIKRYNELTRQFSTSVKKQTTRVLSLHQNFEKQSAMPFYRLRMNWLNKTISADSTAVSMITYVAQNFYGKVI